MTGAIKDYAGRGVMPRSLDLIFDHINHAGSEVEFALKVSYMELYCEKVKDLLRPGNDNLKIAETPEEGVHVPDATQGMLCPHENPWKAHHPTSPLCCLCCVIFDPFTRVVSLPDLQCL